MVVAQITDMTQMQSQAGNVHMLQVQPKINKKKTAVYKLSQDTESASVMILDFPDFPASRTVGNTMFAVEATWIYDIFCCSLNRLRQKLVLLQKISKNVDAALGLGHE